MKPQRVEPRRVGAYRLLNRLGSGQMGEVFLAASPAGRPVALKLVHPQLSADAVFRARFAQELNAIRRVVGGHTPALIDADPQAQRPWMATAHVSGPSLADAVESSGPLPEPVVWGLAAGIAEALAAIHAAGIVHRDLKPSNILLDRDGPKVIDFGVCRALDGTALTATGIRVGTAGYTAPEYAERGEALPAGDVFALGVVLAYAATGSTPFGEGTDARVLYRIVHAPPLEAALSCKDKRLRDLITACLDKDPHARPTPQEILATVAEAADTSSAAMPSAVAARIARGDQETADLLARARAGHRIKLGLGPLLLILAIATISALTLSDRSTQLSIPEPPQASTSPASRPADRGAAAPPAAQGTSSLPSGSTCLDHSGADGFAIGVCTHILNPTQVQPDIYINTTGNTNACTLEIELWSDNGYGKLSDHLTNDCTTTHQTGTTYTCDPTHGTTQTMHADAYLRTSHGQYRIGPGKTIQLTCPP